MRPADRRSWCRAMISRAAAEPLDVVRLGRAIGVIYLPATERQSHYFHVRPADQFDAIIHVDRTRALEPLEVTSLGSPARRRRPIPPDCNAAQRNQRTEVMSHETVSANSTDKSMLVTLTMNPALDITTSADVVRPTDKFRCVGARYDRRRRRHQCRSRRACAGRDGVGGVPCWWPHRRTGDRPRPRSRCATSVNQERRLNTRKLHRQRAQQRQAVPLCASWSAADIRRTGPVPGGTAADAASAEFVVASGSLPPGVAPDFYQCVADICRDLGALLILDTSGGGSAISVRRVYAEAQRA